MGKRIGIDLGTTYSCVSYVDDMGVTQIIDPSEGGGYTTPSVVFFDPEGGAVVGATARSEGAMNPECMVERVKNYMGDPSYILNINGQEYSPAAVSSLILKKLLNDVEEALEGEEIEGVVITCPAYFGDAAREATKKAGENVILRNGQPLKVLQILDEPVAAALAYGSTITTDMQKTVMVYDLGGGTFDCTVMKLNFVGDNKEMEIITTNGDHQLGGKDWDKALANYVRSEFCSRTGQSVDDMEADPESNLWFSENIEKAKIALSKKEVTSLTPSFNGYKEKIEVTRDIFEAETEPLLNQTIQVVEDMLAQKGLSMATDIDEIILVGSSTKMPQVTTRLEREYGKPVSSFQPDKAVAMGAAMVASGIKISQSTAAGGANAAIGGDTGVAELGGDIVIENKNGDTIKIVPKCTKSYGLIALHNGQEVVANIIMKDTEKPASVTRGFGTAAENQTSINLEVCENGSLEENATVEESTKMYESCVVELTPGLPKGAPLEITFQLDANGILVITALDVTNGISKVVTPVRIGGNADDIGMDAVSGTVLR